MVAAFHLTERELLAASAYSPGSLVAAFVQVFRGRNPLVAEKRVVASDIEKVWAEVEEDGMSALAADAGPAHLQPCEAVERLRQAALVAMIKKDQAARQQAEA